MNKIKKQGSLHAGAVEIEKAVKEYYPETDPLVLKKLEAMAEFEIRFAYALGTIESMGNR